MSLPERHNAPDGTEARNSEGWIARLKTLLRRGSGSLRSDLEEVLEEHQPGGQTEFSPAERTMLQNILSLKERRIGDVMVPRADIVAVQQDVTLGNLLREFASAGHSRLVVYNDTLDDPIGMVHIRDIVAYLTERSDAAPEISPGGVNMHEPLSSAKIVRHLLYVPASMPAIDLLVKMQATRTHLALVIDEYGGTDGLVSMEDIVEQIVGDIEDEHDEEAPSIVAQPDGSFIADARTSLEDAHAAIGEDFTPSEALEEEVDTLGGLVFGLAGRIPVRGEILKGPSDFELEVLDADPRRVKRIRIYRRPQREARKRRDETSAPAAAPISAPPSDKSV
ncbi:MAG TPA: hemolysin family protein [Xanthobacteraceae bacterium]|jgi:CBS domain containing-hemolysin-like protein|nr:hemolysin family protein [Xanthobacteraceae bacterium]